MRAWTHVLSSALCVDDTLKNGRCVNQREGWGWSRDVSRPHSSTRGNVGIFGLKWSLPADPRCPAPSLWATTMMVPLSILSPGAGSGFVSEQEDEAPPRPPLPELYSPEDQPPAVPPLPREATIIRHTSVRGLKRQSDERKRDREQGQCVNGDSRVSRGDPWGCPAVCGERDGSGAGVTASDSAHRWNSGHTSVSLSWRPSAGTWPLPPWDSWALRAGTRRCQAEVRRDFPWSPPGRPRHCHTTAPQPYPVLTPFCLQRGASAWVAAVSRLWAVGRSCPSCLWLIS